MRKHPTKRKQKSSLATITELGLKIAPLTVLLMFSSLTSCLVTDPIEFEEEINFPPNLRSNHTAYPDELNINEVIFIDTDEQGLEQTLNIPLMVSDFNIEQSLTWQLYIGYTPENGAPVRFTTNIITPKGDIDRAFFAEIDVPSLLSLEKGVCYKIEILVSSEFIREVNDKLTRIPVEEGDVDRMVGWISLTNNNRPTVDMSTCGR
jgi:hypothetical protein